MAADKIMSYKFDWGDAVRVVDNAPQRYLLIDQGSVCGIRIIDTEAVAEDFCEPIGSALYLVEAGNGEAIEIPERFLEILAD